MWKHQAYSPKKSKSIREIAHPWKFLTNLFLHHEEIDSKYKGVKKGYVPLPQTILSWFWSIVFNAWHCKSILMLEKCLIYFTNIFAVSSLVLGCFFLTFFLSPLFFSSWLQFAESLPWFCVPLSSYSFCLFSVFLYHVPTSPLFPVLILLSRRQKEQGSISHPPKHQSHRPVIGFEKPTRLKARCSCYLKQKAVLSRGNTWVRHKKKTKQPTMALFSQLSEKGWSCAF